MAELHEALKWLSPTSWSDVPEDTDELTAFTTQANEAGELICNSVPPIANGTPFHSATPSIQQPNTAKSSKDVQSSEARPFPPHEEHEKLQKAWGKPYKMNAKDNPLNVAVYKMAGKDRHGAWFARHSVHEGIGFDKFKKSLQREFAHSLSVSGGPGAGAVRGIAADRRVEKKSVDGIRTIEVMQLSAQFPGPTTAREFNTLLITSDDALSHKSAAEADGETHVPRHYMVISKPISHPDMPDRPGYVRGQYESVEMIREIPLHRIKGASKSTSDLLERESVKSKDGSPVADDSASRKSEPLAESTEKGEQDASNDSHDPEINPVEWIMVTRSDPGGGIPRFLVDRGTPEAMLADLTKFLDWACAMDEVPAPDADVDKQEKASNSPELEKENGTANRSPPTNPPDLRESRVDEKKNTSNGVLSSLGQAIQHSIDAYAPAVVSRNINHYVRFETQEDKSSDSSDESSIVSFLSAEENNGELPNSSTPSLPLHKSSLSQTSLPIDPKDLNHHDKEADKAAKDIRKLSTKLDKKRDEEEDRFKKTVSKDPENTAEIDKARERRDREVQKLEERHAHAVDKLRAKEAKERKKADERRRKKDDANKLSLVSRERDDFRTRAELTRRENTLLEAQIEQLQHENTLLTQELGRLGGEDVLARIRDRLASRSRPSSTKSGQSRASTPAL